MCHEGQKPQGISVTVNVTVVSSISTWRNESVFPFPRSGNYVKCGVEYRHSAQQAEMPPEFGGK